MNVYLIVTLFLLCDTLEKWLPNILIKQKIESKKVWKNLPTFYLRLTLKKSVNSVHFQHYVSMLMPFQNKSESIKNSYRLQQFCLIFRKAGFLLFNIWSTTYVFQKCNQTFPMGYRVLLSIIHFQKARLVFTKIHLKGCIRVSVHSFLFLFTKHN